MSNEEKFHVQRHADREVHDQLDIKRLLDSQYVAHVGFIDPDINAPFVIPMGFARDGDRILIHGSTGSRRPMTKKESAATLIVELTLDKLSAKARTGEPSDDEEDIELPLWAGLLPLNTVVGAPITAANAQGIPVPPHIGGVN